jgi:clan AA aspartic protease
MILGQVDSYNQAVVSLDVRSPTGQWEAIDLVIDTGFTGYMTLSPARIAALHLPFQQRQTYTLGDDRDVDLDVHLATVLWDGQPRDIAVLSAQGDALGGMRLLLGYHLFIDVIDGGEVRIEARP